jgi:hypothetical protein
MISNARVSSGSKDPMVWLSRDSCCTPAGPSHGRRYQEIHLDHRGHVGDVSQRAPDADVRPVLGLLLGEAGRPHRRSQLRILNQLGQTIWLGRQLLNKSQYKS